MRIAFVILVSLIGIVSSNLFSVAENTNQLSRPQATNGSKPYWPNTSHAVQISSASCAAAACHGGSQGTKFCEHTIWAPDLLSKGPADPHSKAYRILFNEKSVGIAKALNIAAAHKERLCLKCHAIDNVQPQLAISEGVGCGGCHGPAGKWVSTHYLPDWKGLTNREKAEQGFVPLGNLVNRTMTCTGCHVGDADREVNHDLIAAGHPRLAFEFTYYNHKPDYLHHWQEPVPHEFAARSWVVGQVATLRAAAELLRVRAERARNAQVPWPEFSGYNCFSCHQTIGTEQNGAGLAVEQRTLGIPGWEEWSTATVDVATLLSRDVYPGVSHMLAPDGKHPLPHVDSLRKLMNASRNPNPNRVADEAVAELDALLAKIQDDEDQGHFGAVKPLSLERSINALATNPLFNKQRKLTEQDYDVAVTSYLGCAAMQRALMENPKSPVIPRVNETIGGFPQDLRIRLDDPWRFGDLKTFGPEARKAIQKRFQDLANETHSLEKDR